LVLKIVMKILSRSDFEIVTRTHARLSCSFLGQIFLQLGVMEKKCLKLGSEKMVSLTCFEIVSRPYARVLYSFPGPMVVHFKKVRLERMSLNLEVLVDMVSPIYF